MTTQTTTPISPTEAETRLREAEETLASLESRLADGDASVEQDELTQARERVEYLKRVVLGAHNRARADELAKRQEEAEELWSRWLEDIGADIDGTLDALTELGQATAKALDKLDTVKDRKQGYYQSWSELLRDAKESEVALKFQVGHVPGGDFGAVSRGQGVPQLSPIQILLAVVAEVVSQRPPTEMSGIDKGWWEKLKQAPVSNQLRELRTLRDALSTTQD